MTLLLKFGVGLPSIRTQLCLAVVALAVHAPAEAQIWGPHSVVRWLAERLGSADPALAVPCMLEFLTVLPQEAAHTKAAVHPTRRDVFLDEMKAATREALEVLGQCLVAPGDRTREYTLEAFGAWIWMSGGYGFNGTELASHPLTDAALHGLHDVTTFVTAAQCLSELVWVTSYQGAPDESMMPLAQKIIPEIMKLRPRFRVCARRVWQEEREHERERSSSSSNRNGAMGTHAEASASAASSHDGRPPHHHHHHHHHHHYGPDTPHDGSESFDDDEETVMKMATLFADVGEAYVGLIARGDASGDEPVGALLDVTAHVDDEVCAVSFRFWQSLSQRLHDARAMPSPDTQRILDLFRPVLEKLVVLIQHRVRYPATYDAMSDREKDAWKRNRYTVADTLSDAARVLSPDRLLSLLAQPLSRLVGPGEPFDWVTAEASLFCIRSIYVYGRDAPPHQIAELFTVLPQLPRHVDKLHVTICLTCQAYADWLASPWAHTTAPTLLESIFGLILSGLASPGVAKAASNALFHLCDALAKANRNARRGMVSAVACDLSGAGDVLPPPPIPAPPSSPTDGAHAQTLHRMLPDVLRFVTMAQQCGVAQEVPGVGPAPMNLVELDVLETMKAAAALLPVLPPDQIGTIADSLLRPAAQGITAVAQLLGPAGSPIPTSFQESLTSTTTPVSSSSAPLGRKGLSRLVRGLCMRASTMMRTFPREPSATMATIAAEAMGALWGSLGRCLEVLGDDYEVAEAVCRFLRYGVKLAGSQSYVLLDQMCTVLPALFQSQRHSCYVYMTSELVKVFGPVPSGGTQHIRGLFRAMAESALTTCGSTLPTISAVPDVVDDVYLLLIRAANYAPSLLIDPESPHPYSLLHVGLQTAFVGSHVQHRDAASSMAHFILAVLQPGSADQPGGPVGSPSWSSALDASGQVSVSQIARAYLAQEGTGMAAVRLLLTAVVVAAPRNLIGTMVAPLESVLRATGVLGQQWLGEALAGIPAKVASEADVGRFRQAAAQAAGSGRPQHVDGPGARRCPCSSCFFLDEAYWFADMCRRTPKMGAAVSTALMV